MSSCMTSVFLWLFTFLFPNSHTFFFHLTKYSMTSFLLSSISLLLMTFSSFRTEGKKKREGAGWWWVYILNFYSVDDRKCAVVFLFLYVWHILLNIMISSSIYCKCQIVIPLYGWIKCGVHIQHFKKICSLILDI